MNLRNAPFGVTVESRIHQKNGNYYKNMENWTDPFAWLRWSCHCKYGYSQPDAVHLAVNLRTVREWRLAHIQCANSLWGNGMYPSRKAMSVSAVTTTCFKNRITGCNHTCIRNHATPRVSVSKILLLGTQIPNRPRKLISRLHCQVIESTKLKAISLLVDTYTQ